MGHGGGHLKLMLIIIAGNDESSFEGSRSSRCRMYYDRMNGNVESKVYYGSYHSTSEWGWIDFDAYSEYPLFKTARARRTTQAGGDLVPDATSSIMGIYIIPLRSTRMSLEENRDLTRIGTA